jgi:hypothetical protein
VKFTVFAAIVAAGIFENLFAAFREVTVTVDQAKAILTHRQPFRRGFRGRYLSIGWAVVVKIF